MMKNPAWQPMAALNVRTVNQEQLASLGDLTLIEYLINHAENRRKYRRQTLVQN